MQPLVENALYHGIKQKRGQGFIRVSGTPCGDTISLIVEDNGAGMDEECLKKVRGALVREQEIVSACQPSMNGCSFCSARVRAAD